MHHLLETDFLYISLKMTTFENKFVHNVCLEIIPSRINQTTSLEEFVFQTETRRLLQIT